MRFFYVSKKSRRISHEDISRVSQIAAISWKTKQVYSTQSSLCVVGTLNTLFLG